MIDRLSQIKLSWVLLFAILIVGAFLQFYNFPANPPTLNGDEASIAINANSILHTGKDEFGKTLPLTFRSIDDYKMPVYVYLTSASILVFGFNEFAVRFPSAILGLFSIVVFYFLTLELIKKRTVSLLATFFYAIIPWHVEFSRAAIEANVALFLVLSGMLLFILSLRKNKWLLLPSVLCFVISMLTYLSYPILAPLLGLLFFLVYFKKINFKQTAFVLPAFLGLIFCLFVYYVVFIQTPNTRFKGLSAFSYSAAAQTANQEMIYDGTQHINLIRRFFHENLILTNTSILINGYITQFSLPYFFYDLNLRTQFTPGIGLFYLWMIPFIFLGLFYAIKKQYQGLPIIFGILLLSPIPGSTTWDLPNTIRAYAMVFPLTIFCAIGVFEVFESLKHKNYLLSYGLVGVETLVIFLSALNFFHQYQVHLPYEKSKNWSYDMKEMTNYLTTNYNNYDRAVISTNLGTPYLFMLYYSKYDPKKYLAQGGTISGSIFEQVNHYDKYYFHQFNFKKDLSYNKRLIFIGQPSEFPLHLKPDKVIYFLDGTPASEVVNAPSLQSFINQCIALKLAQNPLATPDDKKAFSKTCYFND